MPKLKRAIRKQTMTIFHPYNTGVAITVPLLADVRVHCARRSPSSGERWHAATCTAMIVPGVRGDGSPLADLIGRMMSEIGQCRSARRAIVVVYSGCVPLSLTRRAPCRRAASAAHDRALCSSDRCENTGHHRVTRNWGHAECRDM